MTWLLVAVAAVVLLYAAALLALVAAGRRTDARAWMRFVPDCVVLARRLLADDRLPPRTKVLLGALVVYLAMPVDVVPDFLPVVGHLDDVLVVALVLRRVLRRAGPDLLREHWPGPEPSLRAVLRLAGAA